MSPIVAIVILVVGIIIAFLLFYTMYTVSPDANLIPCNFKYMTLENKHEKLIKTGLSLDTDLSFIEEDAVHTYGDLIFELASNNQGKLKSSHKIPHHYAVGPHLHNDILLERVTTIDEVEILKHQKMEDVYIEEEHLPQKWGPVGWETKDDQEFSWIINEDGPKKARSHVIMSRTNKRTGMIDHFYATVHTKTKKLIRHTPMPILRELPFRDMKVIGIRSHTDDIKVTVNVQDSIAMDVIIPWNVFKSSCKESFRFISNLSCPLDQH